MGTLSLTNLTGRRARLTQNRAHSVIRKQTQLANSCFFFSFPLTMLAADPPLWINLTLLGSARHGSKN